MRHCSQNCDALPLHLSLKIIQLFRKIQVGIPLCQLAALFGLLPEELPVLFRSRVDGAVFAGAFEAFNFFAKLLGGRAEIGVGESLPNVVERQPVGVTEVFGEKTVITQVVDEQLVGREIMDLAEV